MGGYCTNLEDCVVTNRLPNDETGAAQRRCLQILGGERIGRRAGRVGGGGQDEAGSALRARIFALHV